MAKWQKTTTRYVAFFDIMGFKDMVERHSHIEVVKKLELLKKALKTTESFVDYNLFKGKNLLSETKSITFSDSIIIFSEGNTTKDLCKILLDSSWILHVALTNGIGIKGAISFGEITLDFDNSLFFGRPIIDAYLLHDQIQLYTAVIDNTVESKINSADIKPPFDGLYSNYKTNLKTGKVNHLLVRPPANDLSKGIMKATKMYESVSGYPRIYVDNTLEFLNSLYESDNQQ